MIKTACGDKKAYDDIKIRDATVDRDFKFYGFHAFLYIVTVILIV